MSTNMQIKTLYNTAMMSHYLACTGQQPFDTTLDCRRLHFIFGISVTLLFLRSLERFQQFQIRPSNSIEGQ